MDTRHRGASSQSKGTVPDPIEGADTAESVHGGTDVCDVYPWQRPLVAESARFAVDRQPDSGAFRNRPEFVVYVDCLG